MFKPKLKFTKFVAEDGSRNGNGYIEPKLPTYATTGSSGFDFYTIHDVILEPGMPMIIPTGWTVEIPKKNLEIQIRPRSGCALKDGLTVLNTPGTIDSDYKGEICIIALWTGADTTLNNFEIREKTIPAEDGMGVEAVERLLYIPAGSRIAQGVLCPIIKPEIIEIEHEKCCCCACCEDGCSKDEKLKTETREVNGFGSSGVK